MILFYIIAARARGPLQLQVTPAPPVWTGNPLIITRGPFGRASLSKLQLFFYSLIVLWLLIYGLVSSGALMKMSSSVLILLGISAAGTAGGQMTESLRHRLTSENWSWLVGQRWIRSTLGAPTALPAFNDLVQSDGMFDVTRFQALGFSVVVGLALIVVGFREGLAAVQIDQNLLALIGLSQAVYVGGKAVGSSPIAEIDALVTKLRDLERAFQVKAVSVDPPAENLAQAETKATAELAAYVNAARIAAGLVAVRTKNTTPLSLKPRFP